MSRKTVSAIMMSLLMLGTLALAFNIQPVRASGTIYIRADGSVDPPTASIYSADNVTYIFTAPPNASIVVERNCIMVDGNGYRLQGSGSDIGVFLSGRTNVTVKNMDIHAFMDGVVLNDSSGNIIQQSRMVDCPSAGIELSASARNTIAGNMISNTTFGIYLGSSTNNTLTGNNINKTSVSGIHLYSSPNNFMSENTIKAGYDKGIVLDTGSDNNTLTGNIMTGSPYGIYIYLSSNNSVYHNSFINNSQQVYVVSLGSVNNWDDGYPSGGNYWSDYNGTDRYGGAHQNETGSDGIGDTPYVIDVNNQDNYPLMQPWSPHYTRYSWPTFHHDIIHSGYSESPAPGTNQTAWNFTTGNWVVSSPTVADGKVFVGSNDTNLYALDQYTGARIWNYTTGDSVWSAPTVAGGKVYAGSYDGKVYCLDASTGTLIWNYTTGGCVIPSPAVADGKVYVGSDDGKVYCLDASIGTLVWNYTTGNWIRSSAAAVDGRVYVGSVDGKVYCLDASTGTLIWNYTTGNAPYGIISSPAVVDGRVFVGSDDKNVYALDQYTGARVWNYTTGDFVWSSPAVADGRVYVGSLDGKVYCLDASTGTLIWNYTTGNGVISSPAVAEGKVYIGSNDGRIYSLNASTGNLLWYYTTGGWVRSSPAISDGMVFVGSHDGAVYAFGKVIRVPEDYGTIQEAINAATPGATIWIAPGVYHESLVINKTITLIGKPGSEPIFNGGGSGIAITIVSSGSGSIIAGITITSWDQGIIVQDAASCKIYDNIMSLINNNGVVLQGTGSVSNQVCGNMFEQDSVAVDVTSSSSSNVISQNIISLSSIGLRIETSGNTICENIISENQLGITIVNSNNNAIYHNDFMDNTIAFQLSASTSPGNTWDNGYPSGGNYWSTWTGPDKNSGPNQNILGVSDGIVDTPYTLAVNNKDNYPLTQPFQLHNVGIAYVALGKTVVGRGYCCNITLIIVDYGLYGETFNVAIWVNQSRVDLQQVVLAQRSSTEINFTWDTTGLLYGNYTVNSVADVVPDETLTTDNNYACAVPVHVGVPGDVSSTVPGVYDGVANMKDVAYMISLFNTRPSSPNWNPNADVNNDGVCNMKDIAIAIAYFNQHG